MSRKKNYNIRILKINYNHTVSGWWDGAVSILTGLRVGLYGIRVPAEKRDFFFNSPKRPHRLRGPTSLLFRGRRGSFPGCEVAGNWSWPLISNKWRREEWVELYLHQSSSIPSWRGHGLTLFFCNRTGEEVRRYVQQRQYWRPKEQLSNVVTTGYNKPDSSQRHSKQTASELSNAICRALSGSRKC